MSFFLDRGQNTFAQNECTMANIEHKAKTEILVDGQQAEKQLSVLEKRAQGYRDAIIAANNAGNDKAYKKAAKGLKEVDKEMKAIIRSSYDVNKVLNNLSTTGPKQLTRALSELNKKLNSGSVVRNSKEWDELQRKIRLVRGELSKIDAENKLTGSKWGRFADGFNKYFGVATAALASITGLSFAFRKLAEDVAQMDDTYADVMKTTNMTREQVLELNEVFKQMNTRTSREELNLLARDAGKLGLTAKKDIIDFVEAANQINVALGEDLGEGAVKNIGKMADVYAMSTRAMDELDLKGKMLAIGSAINELGATSTANEEYLVNFTGRLGGIATQADISIQNILGYGSALDQNMQAVEMSATAFQKLIMKMLAEPEKFAKIAGKEMKSFNKLLKEDTNEAVLQVLESLGQKGGLEKLIPLFKDMGLDAARAAQVVSSLASNVDKIRTAQEVSNKAFADGTSVTDEYSIKNNNLQAALEKSRKEFKDAALDLGERLSPALLTSTNYMTYMVKILPSVIDWFAKYGKYVLYLAVVYGSYIAAIKIATRLEAAYNTITAISKMIRIQQAIATTQSTAAQLLFNNALQKGSLITRIYTSGVALLSAAKYLFTGNVTKARIAMQLFSLTLKANPIGVVASAVVALGIAFYSLYKYLEKGNVELSNQQKLQDKAIEETKKYTDEISKEQNSFNALMLAIVGANKKSEIRSRLIKDIKDQYPQYLKYIDMEVLSNRELEAVLRNVNKLYEKRYEVAALKGRTDAIGGTITQMKNKQINIKEELDQLYAKPNADAYDERKIKQLEASYNSLDKSIKSSLDKIGKYNQQIADIETNISKEDTYDGLMELIDARNKEIEAKKDFINAPSLSPKSKARLTKEMNDLSDEVQIYWRKINALGAEDADNNKNNPSDAPSSTPSGDGKEDKVAKQRKKVSDALLKLEVENNENVAAIKKRFRDGEIKSEFDFNNALLDEQTKYDEKRKKRLNELLKTITDSTVKDEINKQITSIESAALDREIKQQAAIKKIILDADPAAAEQEAYNTRLKELGLFDVKREKMTKDQLEAIELLEQQHQEKMSKIERPKVRNQIKVLDDTQAREEQLLAQKYAKGEMSERRYQHQLLAIHIAYTQQKLQIEGITEDQKLQLQKETEDKLRKLYEENSEIQSRINKKKKLENLQDARDSELQFLNDNFSEDLRNTEVYKQLETAIIEKYDLLQIEASQEKQKRMLEITQWGLESMEVLLNSYSSLVSANNEAETAAINRKYDAQIKAAGNNSKRVKKLEEQRDKELKEVNRITEERSFKIQIAQALASTAQSAINAYSSTAAIPVVGPALAPIAAGVATAAGMINVAAIKKQHEAAMANYWDGGYTAKGGKYELAGYVHKGEFVATQESLANPVAKRMLDVIDFAQRNNSVSSLKASDFSTVMEYNERIAFSPRSKTIDTPQTQNDESAYLISVLNEVVEVQRLLNDRLREPFVTINSATGDKGIKKALSDLDRMNDNIRRK